METPLPQPGDQQVQRADTAQLNAGNGGHLQQAHAVGGIAAVTQPGHAAVALTLDPNLYEHQRSSLLSQKTLTSPFRDAQRNTAEGLRERCKHELYAILRLGLGCPEEGDWGQGPMTKEDMVVRALEELGARLAPPQLQHPGKQRPVDEYNEFVLLVSSCTLLVDAEPQPELDPATVDYKWPDGRQLSFCGVEPPPVRDTPLQSPQQQQEVPLQLDPAVLIQPATRAPPDGTLPPELVLTPLTDWAPAAPGTPAHAVQQWSTQTCKLLAAFTHPEHPLHFTCTRASALSMAAAGDPRLLTCLLKYAPPPPSRWSSHLYLPSNLNKGKVYVKETCLSQMGLGPLGGGLQEELLSRRSYVTPLAAAALCGRLENVKTLLEIADKASAEEDWIAFSGVSRINTPVRSPTFSKSAGAGSNAATLLANELCVHAGYVFTPLSGACLSTDVSGGSPAAIMRVLQRYGGTLPRKIVQYNGPGSKVLSSLHNHPPGHAPGPLLPRPCTLDEAYQSLLAIAGSCMSLWLHAAVGPFVEMVCGQEDEHDEDQQAEQHPAAAATAAAPSARRSALPPRASLLAARPSNSAAPPGQHGLLLSADGRPRVGLPLLTTPSPPMLERELRRVGTMGTVEEGQEDEAETTPRGEEAAPAPGAEAVVVEEEEVEEEEEEEEPADDEDDLGEGEAGQKGGLGELRTVQGWMGLEGAVVLMELLAEQGRAFPVAQLLGAVASSCWDSPALLPPGGMTGMDSELPEGAWPPASQRQSMQHGGCGQVELTAEDLLQQELGRQVCAQAGGALLRLADAVLVALGEYVLPVLLDSGGPRPHGFNSEAALPEALQRRYLHLTLCLLTGLYQTWAPVASRWADLCGGSNAPQHITSATERHFRTAFARAAQPPPQPVFCRAVETPLQLCQKIAEAQSLIAGALASLSVSAAAGATRPRPDGDPRDTALTLGYASGATTKTADNPCGLPLELQPLLCEWLNRACAVRMAPGGLTFGALSRLPRHVLQALISSAAALQLHPPNAPPSSRNRMRPLFGKNARFAPPDPSSLVGRLEPIIRCVLTRCSGWEHPSQYAAFAALAAESGCMLGLCLGLQLAIKSSSGRVVAKTLQNGADSLAYVGLDGELLVWLAENQPAVAVRLLGIVPLANEGSFITPVVPSYDPLFACRAATAFAEVRSPTSGFSKLGSGQLVEEAASASAGAPGGGDGGGADGGGGKDGAGQHEKQRCLLERTALGKRKLHDEAGTWARRWAASTFWYAPLNVGVLWEAVSELLLHRKGPTEIVEGNQALIIWLVSLLAYMFQGPGAAILSVVYVLVFAVIMLLLLLWRVVWQGLMWLGVGWLWDRLHDGWTWTQERAYKAQWRLFRCFVTSEDTKDKRINEVLAAPIVKGPSFGGGKCQGTGPEAFTAPPAGSGAKDPAAGAAAAAASAAAAAAPKAPADMGDRSVLTIYSLPLPVTLVTRLGLLESLIQQEVPTSTLESPAVQAMVNIRWQLFNRHVLLFLLMDWLVYMGIFLTYSLTLGDDVDFDSDGEDAASPGVPSSALASNSTTGASSDTCDQGLDSPVWADCIPLTAKRKGLLAALFILTTTYIWQDVWQVSRNGITELIKTPWNFMDIASNACMLVVIINGWRGCDGDVSLQHNMCSIVVLLLFLRLLYYSMADVHMGAFFRMVIEVAKDLFYFFIFLAVVWMGFLLAVISLGPDNEYRDGASAEEFWRTYNQLTAKKLFAMIFGDLGLSDMTFDGADPSPMGVFPLSRAFAALFTVIVTLILLNLLIAIINDTYERIKENEELEAIRNRAFVILEMEAVLPEPFQRWRDWMLDLTDESRWLCLLKREAAHDDDDGDGDGGDGDGLDTSARYTGLLQRQGRRGKSWKGRNRDQKDYLARRTETLQSALMGKLNEMQGKLEGRLNKLERQTMGTSAVHTQAELKQFKQLAAMKSQLNTRLSKLEQATSRGSATRVVPTQSQLRPTTTEPSPRPLQSSQLSLARGARAQRASSLQVDRAPRVAAAGAQGVPPDGFASFRSALSTAPDEQQQ